MARTDKRKGRVKYSRDPAALPDDLRRARYGRFWNHPALESVLVCEGYFPITGSIPIDAVTPTEFAKWIRSAQKKHEKKVQALKKKSPRDYGEMLEAIQQADDGGPDPRFRIAWEQYLARGMTFRFLPAHHFMEHLQNLPAALARHFPKNETVESFMMFAKRAGLRFVGPKNIKKRRISKRSK
jgi:hypothetical protein